MEFMTLSVVGAWICALLPDKAEKGLTTLIRTLCGFLMLVSLSVSLLEVVHNLAMLPEFFYESVFSGDAYVKNHTEVCADGVQAFENAVWENVKAEFGLADDEGAICVQTECEGNGAVIVKTIFLYLDPGIEIEPHVLEAFLEAVYGCDCIAETHKTESG